MSLKSEIAQYLVHKGIIRDADKPSTSERKLLSVLNRVAKDRVFLAICLSHLSPEGQRMLARKANKIEQYAIERYIGHYSGNSRVSIPAVREEIMSIFGVDRVTANRIVLISRLVAYRFVTRKRRKERA